MASDSELCDAVVKSIAPDLPLRTWLESKADLNLVSMSKILRLHFGKPYTTTLFKKLGNAKQMPTETTYEFLIEWCPFDKKFCLCPMRMSVATVLAWYKTYLFMVSLRVFTMTISDMNFDYCLKLL